MEPSKRKFVFTKSLYVLLWIFVVYWSMVIVVCTIDGLQDADWHPIGLLYEGCIWDYLMLLTSLFLALSFKKEKKTHA